MIKVQKEDFDVKNELVSLKSGDNKIGGICSFIGLVRDMAENQELISMTLEQYPGMTKKALQAINKEAFCRWPLLRTTIIHRFGQLKPGDQIVFVAVASAHRESAFQACHFLMDFLKTKAPFWKLEETTNEKKWVNAKISDNLATTRWGKNNQPKKLN
jgi:molybdopterin synthase catalytic subunit